jgi:hypothetical protein
MLKGQDVVLLLQLLGGAPATSVRELAEASATT